jgi:hypothetical protein
MICLFCKRCQRRTLPWRGRRFSQPPVNKHVQVLRRLQRARERRFFVALC